MIFPIGNSKVFRLPKSFGSTRVFFNLGEEVGGAIMDGKSAEHAGNLLGVASNMFDPIGGSTPNKTSAYMPTMLRPFIETAMNKKWNNSPIYPNNTFDIPSPDYKLYNDDINPYFKNITEFAYKGTAGAIDVSP